MSLTYVSDLYFCKVTNTKRRQKDTLKLKNHTKTVFFKEGTPTQMSYRSSRMAVVLREGYTLLTKLRSPT